jgi:sulfate permease, SulP family
MAYAVLAGLPAQYGLYTAVFPGLVYAFLSTSRESPVAAMALVS